ncbi:expressed unknown protein [Seminavis robusta]|uniref:Uncharacterized protein n=1 Tax=Seminavis robusta TaxID=568900 RepID=A0A9N8F137_9STRA|nr:expressed unknown protein [Seminavis robusta]|eukprot:Sro3901_g351791.1  (153) ;mRNA; r:273-731
MTSVGCQLKRTVLIFARVKRLSLHSVLTDLMRLLAMLLQMQRTPPVLPILHFRRSAKTSYLKKGRRLGWLFFFTNQTKPTRATIVGADDAEIPEDFGESEIKKYYGEPGRVNIYTGEIKYVGPKHIEYSINSFYWMLRCRCLFIGQGSACIS